MKRRALVIITSLSGLIAMIITALFWWVWSRYAPIPYYGINMPDFDSAYQAASINRLWDMVFVPGWIMILVYVYHRPLFTCEETVQYGKEIITVTDEIGSIMIMCCLSLFFLAFMVVGNLWILAGIGSVLAFVLLIKILVLCYDRILNTDTVYYARLHFDQWLRGER